MKQFTKRALFMLICATLISTFICAQSKVEVDGIYYYLNNSEASVSSNPNKYIGDITIPETINYQGKTYSVTKINSLAFEKCIELTSIYIPSNVKVIKSDAFDGCTNLTSVTLNNGLQTIENSSFSGCFKSIIIPSSVNSIGKTVFGNCPNLTSLVVESGNTKYDSRENCNAIIETATNKLIDGCAGSFIPTSVTTIAKCSFECVQGLTSIVIPSSVKTIEYGAFHNCKDLKEITLNNGLTTINYGAFDETAIESITIPSSVKKIEFQSMHPNILGNCPNLVSIVVEEGNTVYDSRENCNAIIEKSSNTLISGCKTTIIPNSVKSIKGGFFGCTELTSITIPNSVTNIEAAAFHGCVGLVSIYCNAEQPPVTSNSDIYPIFDTSIYSNATLHVPTTSLDTYKAVNPWKNFKEIVAIGATKYTLTYKVDNEVYKTYQLEEGATITPEAEPEKGGYTFSGWSEIPEKMPAHDVTITGTFSINKYKLIYKVDGVEYKSYEVEYGANITAEASPTKEGYTFSGWSEIPETMPAHDVTITGTFSINKYKLIYKVDGVEYKSFDIEYGATITPEVAPTGKEGYTFSGWSEIPETMPAHDVTVTGTFSINSYKLTYMLDNEVYKEVTYEYGATITPEPTPEGNYASFEWEGLPETMPAKDVVVHAKYTTGINEILMSTGSKRIYSPNGKQLDNLQKGANIIRMKDGTTHKVMKK